MKSYWSCLMKGGAVKKVTYPCHCCNIMSNELVKFKILDNQCDKCTSKNKEKCYHWDVTDSAFITVRLFLIFYFDYFNLTF